MATGRCSPSKKLVRIFFFFFSGSIIIPLCRPGSAPWTRPLQRYINNKRDGADTQGNLMGTRRIPGGIIQVPLPGSLFFKYIRSESFHDNEAFNDRPKMYASRIGTFPKFLNCWWCPVHPQSFEISSTLDVVVVVPLLIYSDHFRWEFAWTTIHVSGCI